MCGGRGGGTRNTSTPLTSGKCLSGPSMTPPLHNVPKSSQVSWLPMPVPVQLGSPLYSAPSLPTTPTWGSPAQACGGPRAAKTQQPSCHATQQAWRQWGGGLWPQQGPAGVEAGLCPLPPLLPLMVLFSLSGPRAQFASLGMEPGFHVDWCELWGSGQGA